jgi:anthranilate synthase component 1
LNTQSTPLIEKEKYIKRISEIKNQIIEGELIQCVLTQRFQKSSKIKNKSLLFHLSNNYLSEYVYQLNCPQFSITGSSPEMFLSVKKNVATIRPVAGTIGNDPNLNNLELENKLKSSIKDNAEHIMLVDLARNDLGKVSQKGTVKVNKLMETQTYNNVIHLVSEVTGIISEEKDSLDAFSATFPIGTLVGAPKIRAAELIHDLEQEGRGPYCGAIGWFSKNGDIETSTIIRTAIKKDGKISFNAGGGIVFDSIPEVEYQETLHKIRAFR